MNSKSYLAFAFSLLLTASSFAGQQDEIDKAMKIYGRDFDWRIIKQSAKFDNEAEQREEHYRQQNGGN